MTVDEVEGYLCQRDVSSEGCYELQANRCLPVTATRWTLELDGFWSHILVGLIFIV